MKILITGANGMLGSSLCRFFLQIHDVYALHRDKKCYAPCKADFSLNLLDQSQLQKVFTQIKPDLVIHCAGLVSVDECEKTPDLAYSSNVVVTEYITQVCAEDTKLVYISTDQVYGQTRNHFETNMCLNPVNQYGKTKYLGEQKVVAHCPDFINIRTNIFGWNVKPGKVSSAEWIYYTLKNGEEITLFYDYTFSPIYTKYLGIIIKHLVEMDFTGVINVGSPSPCSKYRFGFQLVEEFGFDQSLINKGSIKNHHFGAKRFTKLELNCSKLVGLKINAPSWKHSLNEFAKEVKIFDA